MRWPTRFPLAELEEARVIVTMMTGSATDEEDALFDLLVVGGGINGAGIARDAAGRGLKVLLVEQDDLASHTSSASTKLIHGGLRYLEHFEFRLVRESLLERTRLLAIAPHIIEPLDFVVPQSASPRPAWLVRLGLFLYDHLGGGGVLPPTRTISLVDHAFGAGLRDRSGKAFVYSDCRVDDSRLVILNAVHAAERGAEIRTRTRLTDARRAEGAWVATLHGDNGTTDVRARALVNATGPWVREIYGNLGVEPTRRAVRLVKGSHIVLPRLFDGPQAYLIQNPDRRIVFAIPFEGEFTLVGTTDTSWPGSPAHADIDEGEMEYLLATVRRSFARHISATDIRWTYAGIRPLLDDGAANASAVTRDYAVDLDEDGPPLVSVFGGKITTYRRLAERVMSLLGPTFGTMAGPWTATATLPGGDLPASLDSYRTRLAGQYPRLPEGLIARLARSYGTRAQKLLAGVEAMSHLGEHFGGDLYAREVEYLTAHEWARTAEDILFRRSKLGLHVPADTADRLTLYLAAHHAR